MKDAALRPSPAGIAPQDAVDPVTCVRVADVQALRELSVPAVDEPSVAHVVLVIESFVPAAAGWTGRLGTLSGLVSSRVTMPSHGGGPLEVELEVMTEMPLSRFAAAVVPLVVPGSMTERYGSPRVAVAPGAPSGVLALLPEPWAEAPAVEPAPEALLGNDLLISGETAPLAEMQRAHALTVNRTGIPRARANRGVPVVDLRLHTTVGRRGFHTSEESEGAHVRADLRDRCLRIEVAGRTVLETDLTSPLRQAAVEMLHRTASVSLDALVVPELPVERHWLVSRLIEIAATGVVLHSGAGLRALFEPYDRALAAAVALPRPATHGLGLALRSVEVSRHVQRTYGGYLRLSAEVRAMGYSSLVPHVTAVLVTNRPELVHEAVARMAAQTYERLDTVVVLHGAPAPDQSTWAPEVRAQVSSTVVLDKTVPFGEALAIGSARANGELVTKVDDDDLYSPEHIWDLVLAHMGSGAQVVGKQPEYVYLEPYDMTVHRRFASQTYVKQVAGGTMMLSVADLAAVGGWRPVPRSVDRALLQRVVADGGLVYAGSGVGFVYVRHERGHTWTAATSAFLSGTFEQWSGVHAPLLGAGDLRPVPDSPVTARSARTSPR